ncbi:MAG: plasmid pRiA4b ORF-3 family protein [Planctomycetaceae bacterium]
MVAVDNLHEFETEVPETLKPRFREIAAIADRFCEARLNGEYREVCRRILACFCQPGTKIDRGKAASWAAGVVYEAGQVNFLTDPSFEPHCKSEEIAKGCGVSSATMQSKGRDIRDTLRLMRFDPEFTIPSRLESNPLAWMMELPNGMVVRLQDMPDELRHKLDEAGLLPDDADRPASGDWRERKVAAAHEPQPGLVYTLKITLQETKPPIWRRVQLRDCTLEMLHHVIQCAMGWDNSHLYEFAIAGRRFGAASGGIGVDAMWNTFEDDIAPTEETLLSDVIPQPPTKPFQFSYTYDFGDSWEHAIVVERVEHQEEPPTVPVCVAGKRACPPEDCGGVWGYAQLLEALRDPHHPEHAEMKEWYAGPIDPEAFDPRDVDEVFRSWKRMPVGDR